MTARELREQIAWQRMRAALVAASRASDRCVEALRCLGEATEGLVVALGEALERRRP